MMDTVGSTVGQLIGGRYRLERALSESAWQGVLWLGADTLAGDAPVALRQLPGDRDPAEVRGLATRLQGVLHPQVPRFGAVIETGGRLWLVRDWQAGRTYGQLLAARAERQLVFGAGEVLLLLRQLLPVLVALHGQELIHGDLSPANMLRRESDGLPVLLDFGLMRGRASSAAAGATPGYAPPELVRGEAAEPWMDLHALGVVALVLLSGSPPAELLDPVTLAWRWPAALESEPALRAPLQRLLSRDPAARFANASQALQAFQAIPMPESTGPVARADRTLVLVPEADGTDLEAARSANPEEPGPGAHPAGAATNVHGAGVALQLPEFPEPAPEPAFQAPRPQRRSRGGEEREEEAEGGFWPVLIALVLSAVVGTAIGWWLLGRSRPPAPEIRADIPASLPPAEVDQRQQLLNRLRALQIDRGWFLSLVDASLLAQYPERRGRLPGDSLEDAPLRKVWNELAEEWLARVEQLPLPLRRRLGSFRSSDWEQRRQALVAQGLSASVLSQLVTGSTSALLPGHNGGGEPPEPFRQLWYAAAEVTLNNLSIDPIRLRPQVTEVLAADVPASGARLFAVQLPEGHSLALGVNGTPLLQMAVFAADGSTLSARGPLRVVSLERQPASPVQLLVTNDGVAPARISLSLRADPPAPQAPTPPPQPESQPETGPPAAPDAFGAPAQEPLVLPGSGGTAPASPSEGSAGEVPPAGSTTTTAPTSP